MPQASIFCPHSLLTGHLLPPHGQLCGLRKRAISSTRRPSDQINQSAHFLHQDTIKGSEVDLCNQNESQGTPGTETKMFARGWMQDWKVLADVLRSKAALASEPRHRTQPPSKVTLQAKEYNRHLRVSVLKSERSWNHLQMTSWLYWLWMLTGKNWSLLRVDRGPSRNTPGEPRPLEIRFSVRSGLQSVVIF